MPVVSRRFPDLIHGFVNLRPIGGRFQEALFEIVGTLRAGLELQKTSPTAGQESGRRKALQRP